MRDRLRTACFLLLVAVPACSRDAADSGVPGEALMEPLALPDFALIDQEGRPFGREDLLGKVWLVDFIFTSCSTVCPDLTWRMGRLHRALKDEPDVGLLSITVDPERDTPEALTSFAERYRALQEGWYWLTGEKEAVLDLVTKGFFQSVEDGTTPGDIAHSSRIVVLDRQAAMRGFFGRDDREQTLRAVRRLLQEEGGA